VVEDDYLSPLTFQSLIGSSFVGDFYSDLFRADGSPKTQAELQRVPKIWQWFWDNADEVRRDRHFKAELARLRA